MMLQTPHLSLIKSLSTGQYLQGESKKTVWQTCKNKVGFCLSLSPNIWFYKLKIFLFRSFVSLTLNFTIEEQHLNQQDNLISLKCSAEILDLFWRTSEVSVTVRPASRNWYFQNISVFSSSSSTLSYSYIIIVVVQFFQILL